MTEEKNVNLKIVPPSRYLPWIAMAVAAALILFLIAATVGKIKESRYLGKNSQYKNTIAVSGDGRVLAKPDIGQVDLSVVSQAAAVAAAQKDNTDKMNKITGAMKELGVKEDDLQTVNYNIYPRYQYSNGRNQIIGYEVSQTLRVKIRNLDQAGKILENAATLGANQVGSLDFTFDNPEKLKEEARQKAIAGAKKKAEDLAGILKIRLGKITSFSENVSGEPGPVYYAEKEYGVGGGGVAAPDIQTGKNEILVNVTLVYEIY